MRMQTRTEWAPSIYLSRLNIFSQNLSVHALFSSFSPDFIYLFIFTFPCLLARGSEGLDKPWQKPCIGTVILAGQHSRQHAVKNVIWYQYLCLSHTLQNKPSHKSGHTHTRRYRYTCIQSMHIHTKLPSQLQRIVGAEKSRGLMGSYGRWQSVLHAQTNGVWQLPLRKTWGCFLFFASFFFFSFFITAWLTASAFYQTSIVYLCSVQSHLRWQAIRGEPLAFHSFPLFFLSLFHLLCVLPSFLPFALFICKPFCHHDKWILNWHGVGLSPMEVHSFIIKSSKAHYELGGTIMWQRIISDSDSLG